MNNGNDYGKKADIETKVKEYKTPTGNSMMAMIMAKRDRMKKLQKQKEEEIPSSGNSMMAMILAQRNQMKKKLDPETEGVISYINESNKEKIFCESSNKIDNKKINSNDDLINQLNEEKEKNKQLLNELENEKNKVLELTNKIKKLEEICSKNNHLKRINELEKLLIEKDLELNNLKSKIDKNDLVTSINPGEEIVAINFTSIEQDINCPMACKNTTLISRLEEKLYNDYPKYKDYPTYLTVNGMIIKRFKTLEENGVKNGNSIMVNIYDNN